MRVHMKQRTLGYLVLLYAGLNGTALFPLIRAFAGSGANDSQWILLDSLLWIGWVLTAAALICLKPWSITAARLIGVAAILAALPPILIAVDASLPLSISLINIGSSMVPPLILTLLAFNTQQSEAIIDSEQMPQNPHNDQRNIRLAYMCYSWIGVALGSALILSMIPMQTATAQGIGMLIGIPVAMALLLAGLIAFVLTLRYRRERPLLLMACALFSMAAVAMAVDALHLPQTVAYLWLACATAVLLYFSVRYHLGMIDPGMSGK